MVRVAREVLLPVLDPLDRPAEPHGGKTDEHILGIKLAAHAETAADMAFEQMQRRQRAAQDLGDLLLIAVRHLGSAVQLQHVADGIVASDRAARFQRHAGVAADGNVDRDHGVGGAERLLDVAVALFDDHRLGGESRFELTGFDIGRHHRRQFFEIGDDVLGGVLGLIGIFREHHRDRLAHIAHPAARHQRLAKGDELLHAVVAEVDRRQVGDVRNGPGRDHTRTGQGTGDVDGDDAPMRERGAHHAHVELVRRAICRPRSAPDHARAAHLRAA